MARKKSDLTKSRNAKNDEFYTRFNDVCSEVMEYYNYDNDFLRDKTVLLPCDDSEWSAFTRFFALKFKSFGIKKLISTSYAGNATPEGETRGKIFVLERDSNNIPIDTNGDGIIDSRDLKSSYLEGNGDFRSEEVKKLRDEADVIVTNPPFSEFRTFMAWIMEAQKKFLVLANNNAITYKEFFPLIKENKVWCGTTMNKTVYFNVPDGFVYSDKYTGKREIDGVAVCAVPAITWFTNIEHGERNETILDKRLTKAQLEREGVKFPKYDNYDAIEVSKVKDIPSDYMGVMGVPITMLGCYNPTEFDIIDGLNRYGICDVFNKNTFIKSNKTHSTNIDGVAKYFRILIQRKK